MKFKVGDKVKVIKADIPQKAKFIGCTAIIRNVNPNSTRHVEKYGEHYSLDIGQIFVFYTRELVPVNTRKVVITSDGVETLARLYDGNKVIKSATAKCSPEDTFDFEEGARIAFDRLIESPLVKAVRRIRETVQNFKVPNVTVKVETKPHEYKAGDKVKVIGNTCYHNAKVDEVITLGDKVWLYEEHGGYIRERDFEPYTEPEKPKYYNGKVVCVKSGYDWWTVGKVYNVVNGKIKADDGSVYPPAEYEPYVDAEDIRHAGCSGRTKHNKVNEFVPLVE